MKNLIVLAIMLLVLLGGLLALGNGVRTNTTTTQPTTPDATNSNMER